MQSFVLLVHLEIEIALVLHKLIFQSPVQFEQHLTATIELLSINQHIHLYYLLHLLRP
jgi:hypothetical protein